MARSPSGRAGKDRRPPLTKAVEQAKAIADESERYNIGNLQRTVNDPVLALSLLQADRQGRLAFVLDKADPAAGADVWIVEYREQARPTFVRGPFDRDMSAYGRFWNLPSCRGITCCE